MKQYDLIVVVILLFASCTKKTDCNGVVYDKFGQFVPGVEIFLIDNWGQREFDKYVIATTNGEGYFYFTFKEKRQHWYSVTCDNDKNGSTPLKEGKMNNVNMYLNK